MCVCALALICISNISDCRVKMHSVCASVRSKYYALIVCCNVQITHEGQVSAMAFNLELNPISGKNKVHCN